MKTKRATTITLEIPQNPLPEILGMIQSFATETINNSSNFFSKAKTYFAGRNRNKFKNYLPLVILVFVSIAVIFVIGRFAVNVFQGQTLGASDARVELKGPRARTSLDKTYSFPLKDDKGKEIAKLKFFLDDVEIRDEIVIGGQKAVAIKGRTYLIVTIKLTNPSDKFITMKVRNYVRLGLNGNQNEWIAADIHNDDVEIQPESTKQTRLGFPINDSDKDLLLRVGDIEGKKEVIELKFN